MEADIRVKKAGKAQAHQGLTRVYSETTDKLKLLIFFLLRPMSRQYSSNTNSSTSSSFILDYGNSFSEKGSFDVKWINDKRIFG